MAARRHLPDDQALPDLVRCTIADAAHLLGIDEQAVRERIKSGVLMSAPGDGEAAVLLPRRLLDAQSAPPESGVGIPPPPAASSLVIAKGRTDAGAPRRRVGPKLKAGLIVLSAVGTGWILAWFGSAWLARDARPLPVAANRAVSPAASVAAAQPAPAEASALQPPSGSAAAASEPAIASSAASVPQPGAAAAAPAAPQSADELMRRMAQAEADVRSGWLEAILDYGSSTSSAEIRFDIARADEPRMQIAATYISGDQVQRVEQIVIGEQVWEKRDTAPWQPIAGLEGVWSQVQTFLPRASGSTQPTMRDSDGGVELSWHDSLRDTDVAVLLDPVTGEPREMRQQARGADTALRVVYRGWNTPVQITPP